MDKAEEKKDLIAQRLRVMRAEHNLTQADVAQKLGVSQQTYSKYENKSANLDSETIVKLCELFGVSSDYLLGIDMVIHPGASKKSVPKELSEDRIKIIVKKVIKELSYKDKTLADWKNRICFVCWFV